MRRVWLRYVPFFISALLSVLSSTSMANDTFSRTFSGYDPRGVQAVSTDDGGFFVSSIVRSDLYFGNIWLIRTDHAGEILWDLPILPNSGDRDYESGGYILPAPDGSCIITGYSEPRATGENTDIFLVKVTADGEIQWQKIIGEDSDNVYRVEAISGSEAGIVMAVCQPYNSSLFVMYDQSGNELWRTKLLESESYSIFEAVTATRDGGLLAVATDEYRDERWLIHVDAYGEMEWLSVSPNQLIGSVVSVVEAVDGGYAFCGRARDSGTFVIRTDEAGNILWSYAPGISLTAQATCVEATDNGMFALTGREGCDGDIRGWLALLDDTGEIQWKHNYDYAGEDIIESVSQTPDGGFVLCGTTGVHENGGVWLLRTDNEGQITGSEAGYPAITECTEVFAESI